MALSPTPVRPESPVDLRRNPRLRIAVPFTCGFARMGVSRWKAQDKSGCGVVFDLSIKGARVMSPVAMTPGDELAISFRLPHQPTPMNVDATVRWHQEHVFGLEFSTISHAAEVRLRKFLTQAAPISPRQG